MGLHPYSVMFNNSAEVVIGRFYMVEVRMEYSGIIDFVPMETVWGGSGEARVKGEDGRTEFWFLKLERDCVRSSVSSGQIPLLFYVD